MATWFPFPNDFLMARAETAGNETAPAQTTEIQRAVAQRSAQSGSCRRSASSLPELLGSIHSPKQMHCSRLDTPDSTGAARYCPRSHPRHMRSNRCWQSPTPPIPESVPADCPASAHLPGPGSCRSSPGCCLTWQSHKSSHHPQKHLGTHSHFPARCRAIV